MSDAFDLCVIGSGAGGGPVAAAAAEAGYRVLVLEKGPWFEREQFYKDEIELCRRPTFWPRQQDEPHVWEWLDGKGGQRAVQTADLWNGNLVGGSSVLMSGFFLRMKPPDFRLLSTYGPVAGADVADWPISYDDLEPYYARVEQEVGVSGLVPDLPEHLACPRSTEELPFDPTTTPPMSDHIDRECERMGLHVFGTPRAILPEDWSRKTNGKPIKRRGCAYAGYCGSYGCRTGAKGSSLEAFLPRAQATGRCEIRSRAMVTRLVSDARGNLVKAEYIDAEGKRQQVEASVFVVACQAIESARLLLNSRSARHPAGLANRSGQVGRNLLFSTFGAGWGDFPYAKRYRGHEKDLSNAWLRSTEPFVNRSLQDWYYIDDPKLGQVKGGTIDFLLQHPNPISAATNLAFHDQVPEGRPMWGQPLKEKIRRYFQDGPHLKLEVFGEWLPNPRCRVTIDPAVKDKWGQPVARVNTWSHPRNREIATYLVERGMQVLRGMGAENVRSVRRYGGPSTNLVGGTCRFGDDPKRSVLDRDCRAHDVPNLFVTDGSFMPSGGAVPFTFTLYANALRVADKIIAQLGGKKAEQPR